jgi:hypothetical protein
LLTGGGEGGGVNGCHTRGHFLINALLRGGFGGSFLGEFFVFSGGFGFKAELAQKAFFLFLSQ